MFDRVYLIEMKEKMYLSNNVLYDVIPTSEYKEVVSGDTLVAVYTADYLNTLADMQNGTEKEVTVFDQVLLLNPSDEEVKNARNEMIFNTRRKLFEERPDLETFFCLEEYMTVKGFMDVEPEGGNHFEIKIADN